MVQLIIEVLLVLSLLNACLIGGLAYFADRIRRRAIFAYMAMCEVAFLSIVCVLAVLHR